MADEILVATVDTSVSDYHLGRAGTVYCRGGPDPSPNDWCQLVSARTSSGPDEACYAPLCPMCLKKPAPSPWPLDGREMVENLVDQVVVNIIPTAFLELLISCYFKFIIKYY